MPQFTWQSVVKASQKEVFDWHVRPGAFQRLSPPWKQIKLISYAAPDNKKSRVKIRVPILGPLSFTWELEHDSFDPPNAFSDQQIKGPFQSWRHVHSFTPAPEKQTVLSDSISFSLPLINALVAPFIKSELTRLFAFRHELLKFDLALHSRYQGAPRKTVLICGSSGFIGSAVSAFLETAGHTVRRLVRRKPSSAGEFYWNPSDGFVDTAAFDKVDAVINFSGANIAEKRWSTTSKKDILESRTGSALLLAETIASLDTPPELAIMASATGFYGDTQNTTAIEETTRGTGFLADTCQAWENASLRLEQSSCRRIHLRIGTVLGANGGALKKMLPPFRLGVGGRLGKGTQIMSWIALQDLLGIIEHLLYTPGISGPINAVSPNQCTNSEFTRTLGSLIRRPAVCAAPAWALRILLGEMADEMLLSNSCVAPSALTTSGYSFLFPELSDALRFQLGIADTK